MQIEFRSVVITLEEYLATVNKNPGPLWGLKYGHLIKVKSSNHLSSFSILDEDGKASQRKSTSLFGYKIAL